MKAYIKSYKEIEEVGKYFIDEQHHDDFSGGMQRLCKKGPFVFYKRFKNNEKWYNSLEVDYNWHINWLIPFPKDKQYLLDFK